MTLVIVGAIIGAIGGWYIEYRQVKKCPECSSRMLRTSTNEYAVCSKCGHSEWY